MYRLKTKTLGMLAVCVLSMTACLLPSAPNDDVEHANDDAEHANMGSESMAPNERGEQGDPPAAPDTVASNGDSYALGVKPLSYGSPDTCFYPVGTGDTPWFGGYGGSGAPWQQNYTYGLSGSCAAFYAAKIILQGNSSSGWPWYSGGNGFDWRVVSIALAWYRPSDPDLLYRSGNYHGWTQSGGGTGNRVDYGWQYCPAGSVLVGVRGYANNYVNAIGFACKHLQTGVITFLPEVGINEGSRFEYGCDWNRGVMWTDLLPGFARTGVIMDGIEFNCRRPWGNTVPWLQ